MRVKCRLHVHEIGQSTGREGLAPKDYLKLPISFTICWDL